MRSPNISLFAPPGSLPTGSAWWCCATCASAWTMRSRSLMARARSGFSTIRARSSLPPTAFSTTSPTTPSASRDGGYTSGRTPAMPRLVPMQRSTERQLDQLKKTVEAEQRRENGDRTAEPEQAARGADDADRAQDDGDLEERAAVVEAKVAALCLVARRLEAPRLGEELLLARAVHRLALEMLDCGLIVGDPFLDGHALCRGEGGRSRQQRLERVGGELISG